MKLLLFKTAALSTLPFLFIKCHAPAGAAAGKDYKLVWSDEFNYSGLPDSMHWNYDLGGHGWCNQELQFYTEKRLENGRVENGKLIIEARKEDYQGSRFTSARLISKGKGDWRYGKVEVSARLPRGRGTWPAIWMLPTENTYGGWPVSGEIDIMEHVGFNPGYIHASVHTEAYNHIINTQKSDTIYVADAMVKFHLYHIEWTPEKIDFLMDGKLYHTFKNEHKTYKEWPYDQPFHLLLNIAVGGAWGGAKGVDESIYPQRMEVDYVRVFQKK